MQPSGRWTSAEYFVTQIGKFIKKNHWFLNYNNDFYYFSYPTALEMVASGRVNVKPLITHRYKLEESVAAFETARTGAGGAIKVMISCSD